MMQKFSELANKDITRREFLAVLGFGLASLFGLATILRLMGKENPLHDSAQMGYGDGAYGG